MDELTEREAGMRRVTAEAACLTGAWAVVTGLELAAAAATSGAVSTWLVFGAGVTTGVFAAAWAMAVVWAAALRGEDEWRDAS